MHDYFSYVNSPHENMWTSLDEQICIEMCLPPLHNDEDIQYSDF